MISQTQSIEQTPERKPIIGTNIKRKIVELYTEALLNKIKEKKPIDTPMIDLIEEKILKTRAYSDTVDRSTKEAQEQLNCRLRDNSAKTYEQLMEALRLVQNVDLLPSPQIKVFSIVTLKYDVRSTENTVFFFIVPALGGMELPHKIKALSVDTELGKILLGYRNNVYEGPISQGDEIEGQIKGEIRTGEIVKVI